MRYSASLVPQNRTGWIRVWVLASLLVPHISWAAGTIAGTSINNTATLSYSLGATPQPDIPVTSTAFVVDEKINLTVSGGITTNVASGSTAQATTFTVTNNANSPLDFSLSVVDAISGDDFNPVAASCAPFVEEGTTPGYDVLDTATFINELAVDATVTVYAVCDIPASATNSQTALVGMVATAHGDFTGVNNSYVATPSTAVIGPGISPSLGVNSPNVDIVFADATGTDDGPGSDAAHSARNTYQIGGPAVTVTKTASVADPSGGSVVMPGAVITYQIVVTVSGSGTANALVIDDLLSANTSFVAGSISLDGAPQTDANDPPTDNTDFGITAATTVTVSLGNVAAPATHVITFRATIN